MHVHEEPTALPAQVLVTHSDNQRQHKKFIWAEGNDENHLCPAPQTQRGLRVSILRVKAAEILCPGKMLSTHKGRQKKGVVNNLLIQFATVHHKRKYPRPFCVTKAGLEQLKISV
jgi:hypothetical protein